MSLFKKIAAIATVMSLSLAAVACTNEETKTPATPTSSASQGTAQKPTEKPAEAKKAEPIDAYRGLTLENATAKSDNVVMNNKNIVCAAGGWIYYEQVDFGTRGAKSITAKFSGKKGENGVIKVYIDGGANGDVSGASLVGTVDVLGGKMDFGTNLTDKVQDIHSVALVFESSNAILGETWKFDFAKAEFTAAPILTAEDQIEFEDLVENN